MYRYSDEMSKSELKAALEETERLRQTLVNRHASLTDREQDLLEGEDNLERAERRFQLEREEFERIQHEKLPSKISETQRQADTISVLRNERTKMKNELQEARGTIKSQADLIRKLKRDLTISKEKRRKSKENRPIEIRENIPQMAPERKLPEKKPPQHSELELMLMKIQTEFMTSPPAGCNQARIDDWIIQLSRKLVKLWRSDDGNITRESVDLALGLYQNYHSALKTDSRAESEHIRYALSLLFKEATRQNIKNSKLKLKVTIISSALGHQNTSEIIGMTSKMSQNNSETIDNIGNFEIFWSILTKIPTYGLDDAESFSEHFDHFNLVVGALRGRKKGKNN